MDILNFISWIKAKRRIKTAPKGSLIAVGVPTASRDDRYLTTAMTLNDAVTSECIANNTYKAGIYDDPIWTIEPSMLRTCTKIEDYPAFPTAFAANLVGYKVGAATYVNNVTNVVQYIGTVEITNPDFPNSYIPWKSSGNVVADAVLVMNSAFASGALVTDLATNTFVPADYMGISIDQYAPGAFDLYLVVASTIAAGNITADLITFEYEFLVVEGSDVKFTIY